jgi:glycosyltransferase involved in cell wall biosynthesis
MMMRILMCGPDAPTGGVATHTRCITEELGKMGVNVISCTFTGSSVRRMYHRTLGLILRSWEKRKEFDIIHVQSSGGIMSFVSAVSGVIAAKLTARPLIVTYHYNEPHLPSKILFRYVIRNLRYLFLVSNLQKKIVLDLFPEYAGVISVIPNGFNKKSFSLMDSARCRDVLELPRDKKIIVIVGNLLEVKGHHFLLEAIRTTGRKDIFCFIVGDGPLKNKLQAEIKADGLEDQVTLVGFQPLKDLPLWMNAADIFVLSSLSEGNPTVMFEALGCGLPFIGTRVGGVPDIITSDEYGLLVDPADSGELAEKILTALNRNWDREKISAYAEHYTWENIAKGIVNVYEQVL